MCCNVFTVITDALIPACEDVGGGTDRGYNELFCATSVTGSFVFFGNRLEYIDVSNY